MFRELAGGLVHIHYPYTWSDHVKIGDLVWQLQATWYGDFIKNRKIITIHLHIPHPTMRNILGICKDHLNYITMADC